MVCSLILLVALQADVAGIRRLFEENLAREERQSGPLDARTAQAARDLGLFLKKQGDTRSAEAVLARALAADEHALGPAAPQTLADAAELAALQAPPQAEPLWRRAAGSSDAHVAAAALAALGELKADTDIEAAVTYFRKALAKEEQASGKDSAIVAVRLNAFAVLVGPPEGVTMLERALAIDRRLLGETHPETSTTEANLAGMMLDTGKIDAALRLANAALSGLEQTLGPDNPRTASVSMILAFCWRAKRDRAQAESYFRKALAIDKAAHGADHPDTVQDMKNLADFLRETGRANEAAALEKRLP
jgi:tetratricopeptide (TPR) repeat protein